MPPRPHNPSKTAKHRKVQPPKTPPPRRAITPVLPHATTQQDNNDEDPQWDSSPFDSNPQNSSASPCLFLPPPLYCSTPQRQHRVTPKKLCVRPLMRRVGAVRGGIKPAVAVKKGKEKQKPKMRAGKDEDDDLARAVEYALSADDNDADGEDILSIIAVPEAPNPKEVKPARPPPPAPQGLAAPPLRRRLYQHAPAPVPAPAPVAPTSVEIECEEVSDDEPLLPRRQAQVVPERSKTGLGAPPKRPGRGGKSGGRQ
ncbi:hypothetical protein EDC01DRAFT_732879 [Geopyxis carbonaria]|nr:hypothetical protein EDC01DRAFT_732879 [Geopyxis carbonaria]